MQNVFLMAFAAHLAESPSGRRVPEPAWNELWEYSPEPGKGIPSRDQERDRKDQGFPLLVLLCPVVWIKAFVKLYPELHPQRHCQCSPVSTNSLNCWCAL